uniref:Uncharacterized protein n=1 Tax=Candidatus Kentrum sp. DK TaxID=2126562 RepID=A0A450TRW3_9GAMM|nr:MAG: hypothetical protein BECKDK2373B_GA0170837_13072 [Candidatus Kentron sp. DK]
MNTEYTTVIKHEEEWWIVLRPALFKRNRPDLFQERQKLVPRHQRGIYGP